MPIDALSAEIRRGTNQKDMFFLPPRQRAFLNQNGIDELHFSVQEVRTRGLCSKEVGNETVIFLDELKRRKIFFVERVLVEITHSPSFSGEVRSGLHSGMSQSYDPVRRSVKMG